MSRGKVLELLRPDESGKMQTVLATEVFGAIRALVPFRLTGASRDYIIIGSDSGRIVIVDYNKERNAFVKVGVQQPVTPVRCSQRALLQHLGSMQVSTRREPLI